MESNAGLASKLTFYESLTGDWRYIYHFQKRVHEITAADVKRVAKQYFVPQRQVMAALEEEFGRGHWPRLMRRWRELVSREAGMVP
jgi:predicted Zn-dependent peptidase